MSGPAFNVHEALRSAMQGPLPPLFVAGVGVSLATAPGESWTWPGLVRHAIDYAEQLRRIDSATADGLRGQLRDGDAKLLVEVATKIEDELRLRGDFDRWLAASVGSLKIRDRAVIDALRRLTISLATTNYDDLLTQEGGPPPVPWTNHGQQSRVLRFEQEGVLHLHGVHSVPESVVFGKLAYARVLQSRRFQFLEQAAAMGRTLIFVGCGAGLEDPNMGALLRWLDGWSARHSHFRLCTKAEAGQHGVASVIDVEYGDAHERLPEYLLDLPPGTARRAAGYRQRFEQPTTRSGPRLIADHRGEMRTLAVDSKGERVATGGADRMVRMWPVSTAKELLSPATKALWKGSHRGPVDAVMFRPGGRLVVAASEDGNAHLRSVDDGTVLRRIKHDGTVNAVAFDATGARLATAGGALDHCAKVWNLDPPVDAPATTVTHGQLTQISSVAFSPNGRCLATAGADGAIRIWSLPRGVPLWDSKRTPRVAAIEVAYDASGTRLACAYADGHVTVFSAEALSGLELDDDEFAEVELTAQLAEYASRLRDTELLRQWCVVENGQGLVAAALSSDGTCIATGSEDGSVHISDVEETSRRELEHYQAAGPVVAVAFIPDEPFVVTGLRSGQVHVWDFG
jgi:SIR2-like domain/WD domain, G-beta repeat